MTKFVILYGTESGNSEMVAEDLRAQLADDYETEISDLRDFDPANLAPASFYIVVCSSYGEGELPDSALPFSEALDALAPDLTGLRYAMFGLGDTFYEETYSQGSEIIDRRFAELGATRVGEYGRHDASTWDPPSDRALEWLPTIVEEASAETVATA